MRSRDAEVHQLDLTLFGHHHVTGLDVPVYQPGIMHGRDRPGCLGEPFGKRPDGRAIFTTVDLLQRAAFDPLEHDVRLDRSRRLELPVPGLVVEAERPRRCPRLLPVTVDEHDVGAVESRQVSRFLLEPQLHVFRHAIVQQFDRHLPARAELPPDVNRPIASFADRPTDQVVAHQHAFDVLGSELAQQPTEIALADVRLAQEMLECSKDLPAGIRRCPRSAGGVHVDHGGIPFQAVKGP